MKKIILIFSCFLILAANSFAAIPNEKVLKSFEAIFNSATEIKWFDHKEYFEVRFVQANIRTNVKFDMDGNFISSMKYFQEQQLPANVLWKVKMKYADKKIFGVTEITTPEEIIYYVKLEDSKSWLTIKVYGNGQMDVFEKYRKG